MISKFSILLLATYLYFAEATKPACYCTSNHQPVCGTDGVTYSNQCELSCADAQLLHEGECGNTAQRCTCTRDNKAVCGSDGTTYTNACELNCATAQDPTLTVLHQGACNIPAAEIVCMCTLDYRPVCGTDGKTYGNACSLDCAKSRNPTLQISRVGPCQPVKLYPYYYSQRSTTPTVN